MVRATIRLIDQPDTDLDSLMQIIPAPDFPAGAFCWTPPRSGKHLTGRGRLHCGRHRCILSQGKSGRHLLCITEITYQVNKAQMLGRIWPCLRPGRRPWAAYDIRDESDRTGMRAVVEIKKGADPEAVLAYLYRYSDLQTTVGVSMVAIAGGRPEQMGLISAINYYIAHQKQVFTRRAV